MKLSPSALRVLLIVIRRHAAGESLHLRDLAQEAGVNLFAIQGHLARLRRRGLVSWEDRKYGTLRPRVRFVPVSALTAPTAAASQRSRRRARR